MGFADTFLGVLCCAVTIVAVVAGSRNVVSHGLQSLG